MKLFYFLFVFYFKFCFVYLDSYDVSFYGVDEGSFRYKEVLVMVCKYNKNDDFESVDGFYGLNRCFVEYNGVIGFV